MIRLAAAFVLCALAAAGGVGIAHGDEGAASSGVLGRGDPGIYPPLRAVGQLSGSTTDVAGAAYPALAAPERLALPPAAAVEAARRFAETRAGRISFAAGGERGGLSGLDPDAPFPSASLSKAMLLAAYLDQLERRGTALTEADAERLRTMIVVSDNDSADWLFRRLDPGALQRLARRAGLRSFAAGGHWANVRVTAADQVRFFLALDRLLPASRRDFARELLSRVVSFQSWGIPRVARPRWRVFFKGGWRPNGDGALVSQAALLERGDSRLAIAVLTDASPDENYGRATVRGVAERLLREPAPAAAAVRRGRLAPLSRLARYRPPAPKPLQPLAATAGA